MRLTRYKTLAALGAVLGLTAASYGSSDNFHLHGPMSSFSVHGTLNLADYQGFLQEDFPDYTGPAVVEIAVFRLKPGEAFPWHYHEGLAYAVLVKGTVTEDEGCGRLQDFSAGAGFVEIPGGVHRVINHGRRTAVIYGALMYPAGSSDLVVTDEPSCP